MSQDGTDASAAAQQSGKDLDNNNPNTSQLDDSDETSRATQLYDKLYGKFHTKMYNKLHTQLYCLFSTRLGGEFRTEPNDKLPADRYPQLFNELYNKLYTEFYPKFYEELYPVLYNEVYTDHYNETNTEFYEKLQTEFYRKFYTDIYKELHPKLDNDLRSKLYNQFYNQLYNQTTGSVDRSSSKPSPTSSPPSTLASKDEDDHPDQHQQQQQPQQVTPQVDGHADSHIETHQDSMFASESDPHQQAQDNHILPLKSRQAFAMTKVTLPPQFSIPTVTIDTKEYEYAFKMDAFDAWAIPTFVLLFLSFNPDVMLPLASLREPVLESCLQLAEDTFYTYTNIDAPATLVPTLLHSIVFGRICKTVYRLYPQYKVWHQHQSGMRDLYRPPIPHLEKGPIPELQAIVEDSLVACNPIKILVSFLGAMVDKYRSFARPMKQDYLADKLLDYQFTHWMHAASELSGVYGLFLWDSSKWGVSDAEWDALVQYMTIITTEIFPNAYERISTIESKGYDYFRATGKLSSCDGTLNEFIRGILLIITPCFLYHYRPMKNQIIPKLGPYWVGPFEHMFTAPGYFDGLKAFPGILHSCTMEYLQNPSKFKGLPTAGLPKLSVPEVMSRCSKFMTEYCFGVNEFDDCDRTDSLRWKMPYRQYNQSFIAFKHLNNCVLRHPPVNDPVYQRIASIFPKNMKSSNVIDAFSDDDDEKNNPRFTCPP